MGNGSLVPKPVSRGVQPCPEAVSVRVLLEVREESTSIEEAQRKMLVEASAGARGVQVSTHVT